MTITPSLRLTVCVCLSVCLCVCYIPNGWHPARRGVGVRELAVQPGLPACAAVPIARPTLPRQQE